MITNHLFLTFLMFFMVSLGFALNRFKWIKQISPALVIMLFGAILSNFGIVPLKSDVYDILTGPITSLSIIFLLLAFDLNSLRKIGFPIVIVFCFAVLGSCVGAFAGGIIFKDEIFEAWKLSGALTGTYSGGSLNLVAVSRELKIDSSILAATTAADNITTAIWLGVNMTLPVWLSPFFKKRKVQRQIPDQVKNGTVFDIKDILYIISLGLVILLLSNWLYQKFPLSARILWITTIALAVAQLPFVKKLRGSFELGILGLYLFFAVIGISSNIQEVIKVGPAVFYFTLTVVGIHGVFIYLLSYFAGFDLPSVAIASQAAIGGPSTAMAIAVSKWPDLTLAAVIVGLLGYALGNYAGLGIANLVFILFY